MMNRFPKSIRVSMDAKSLYLSKFSHMKYFLVKYIQGEYSERTVQNLFLLSSQEEAEMILEALTNASKLKQDFINDAYQKWHAEYLLQHPEPVFVAQIHATMSQPQAPHHLRNLPKKERRRCAAYTVFLQSLKEYENWIAKVREADGNHRKAFDKIHAEWQKQYEIASVQYKNENLTPLLKACFIEQYVEKLIPYVGYGHYSWEEIEVF